MNNDSLMPLFLGGSAVIALLGSFFIMIVYLQKRKQNAYQLEKRQMIFDHQNNILRTKIEEQETTMDQISRELHDNIKSVLGFAQMSMYHIANLATDKEQAVQIDKTNKIIGDVIDELHNISHSLNSNFVKNIGLIETITKELEHIELAKNIACTIDIKGDPIDLSPEKEIHIFRIAQEAMQNCIKHANATSIKFTLSYEPDTFIMKMADNGRGFDKNKLYELKGLGFLNMFQRARYVHGSLDVQSVPMQGSTISLTLNLNKNDASN